MDLRDIKAVVTETGLVADICGFHKHVNVRYDDLDEESITFLVATPEGFVKEDNGILPTDGKIIAKNEDELRSWLKDKAGCG